jgi:outer membrane protein insertion porin family
MKRPTQRRLLALALAAALSAPVYAQNFEAFTVQDIRVDGLQRLSSGTVFSYLPVDKGDVMNGSASGDTIRALYKTGFFSDVSLEREGNILVVKVIERPSINTISILGNKDIKTEELEKGLKNVGLAEGEIYNPLNLDRITQELLRQYNNRGKYNTTITPSVKELDRNRVDISVVISEGKAAKIRDINIVGNEKFSDKELREDWESGTSNWLSWYRRDDQYSREKLSGDLEKLNNYYLDRGYIDFNVDSTQVAIDETKQSMFLSASVTEGEIYTISNVEVSGETIVPREEIEKMVIVKSGDTFSRARLELISDAITAYLGNIGYAFAKVEPIPDIDREKRTVGLNFAVQPGPRVKVRRIAFKGNARTNDEVLRREMRQFEGSWFSQSAIDRSKVRLQRLGFFEEVDVETPAISGKNDEVDVVINVKERNAGSFQFGVGYQALYGVSLNLQLDQNNFLGSGNKFSINVQNSVYAKRLNFSFVDPYFTENGISVGYNINYSDYNYDTDNINTLRYNSTNAAGEVQFVIPYSEFGSFSLAAGIDRNQLDLQSGTVPPATEYYLIRTLGEREYPSGDCDLDPSTPDGICSLTRRWNINAGRLRFGWARDTRNDFLLPNRGMLHRLTAELVTPGSDLQYYSINYEFDWYKRLTPGLLLRVGGDIGYGDSYGDTGDAGLPFFRNFYGGGPGTLRGFEQNTLGPQYDTNPSDSFQQPLGGNIKTFGTVELLFPKLFNKARGSRFAAFVDFGNVFGEPIPNPDPFIGDNPNDYISVPWKLDNFRASAGLSLQWQSPLGPIAISYAIPLKYNKGSLVDTDNNPATPDVLVGKDRIERLQFTFGRQF